MEAFGIPYEQFLNFCYGYDSFRFMHRNGWGVLPLSPVKENKAIGQHTNHWLIWGEVTYTNEFLQARVTEPQIIGIHPIIIVPPCFANPIYWTETVWV